MKDYGWIPQSISQSIRELNVFLGQQFLKLTVSLILLGVWLAVPLFNTTALYGVESQGESEDEGDDDSESALQIPSWRSFDQWLSRSGPKLSDEQTKKLEALRKEVDPHDGKPQPEDQPPPDAEQQKISWRMYQAGLSKILTPEQVQRIRKQWYHFRGMTVLGDDEVAEKLALTDDQRKKVDESLDTYHDKRKAIVTETRKTGKTGRKIRREQIAKLKENRDEELDSLLTPEQKKKFETLGDEETASDELLPAPTLSDDFIELGPATKKPPKSDG